MQKIQEVFYFPTLRCNLNCQHCGENQDINENEEVNSIDILSRIKDSIFLEGVSIVTISGGEPFLNHSFPEFIIEGIKETDYCFDITCNGYYTERIKAMIERIKPEDRSRLSFHISIDGLEKTHNKIRRNMNSFQQAVQTVRYLAEVRGGVNLQINTVVQNDNLSELEDLKNFFVNISSQIGHNFIPLGIDQTEEQAEKCIYTNEYQKRIWQYENVLLNKKRVLSKGKYGIYHHCHAGEKNIVIGPDGKVYACVTGAYYKSKEFRQQVMLGDLRKNTLDEIFLDFDRREEVNNAVYLCEGCCALCEVSREVRLFGRKIYLSKEEVALALQLDTVHKIGEALLDYEGWHEIERYGDPRCLCWSNDLAAKIFIPARHEKKVLISYRRLSAEYKEKIYIDGEELCQEELGVIKAVQKEFLLDISKSVEDYITITFVVDWMKSPDELFGNGDTRQLGIGLENVTFV